MVAGLRAALASALRRNFPFATRPIFLVSGSAGDNTFNVVDLRQRVARPADQTGSGVFCESELAALRAALSVAQAQAKL